MSGEDAGRSGDDGAGRSDRDDAGRHGGGVGKRARTGADHGCGCGGGRAEGGAMRHKCADKGG